MSNRLRSARLSNAAHLRGTSQFDNRYHPHPLDASTPMVEAKALLHLLKTKRFTFAEIVEMIEITPTQVTELRSSLGELTAASVVQYRTAVLAELCRGGTVEQKPVDPVKNYAKRVLSEQSIVTDVERQMARQYLESRAFIERRLEERNGR